jgi:PmbA protein
VALSRATAEDPAAGLPEDGFATPDALPELELLDAGDRASGVDSRIDAARRAERAARATDPRITNSEGSQATSGFARVVYGNTAGFLGEYESGSHGLFAEPLARENGSMQRDYWMSSARRLADLEAPVEVGRHAAVRAVRRLGARKVASCEVPVIFDPLTAASLWRQVAGLVSGYAVYRGTSFLAEKLGERVASERITLVDDALRPSGLGSRPFDGEGLPSRRTTVLDRGKLASFLLDTYSARKLGAASTGNASRSAASAPGVGATNLGLAPGDATLEEIVADTPKGLLVTELIGMGFNPTTGDYSRGAAGIWIENGVLTHAVEEVTIAANFGDMLTNIETVGSDLLWLSRIGSPSVRVSKMTVAGGT